MKGSSEAAGSSPAGHSQVYPRLQAFALALTGSPRAAATLARGAMARMQPETQTPRGQTPPLIRAYRELHALWLQGASSGGQEDAAQRPDPRCFAVPADTPEAAARNRGLAKVIVDLPAQQRATLLLVYGEGLSYDEAAEVFDTEVKSVMTRVVRGHVAVGHWLDQRAGSGSGADANHAPAGSEAEGADVAGYSEPKVEGKVA